MHTSSRAYNNIYKVTLAVLLLLIPMWMYGQDDVEYRMDIGAGAGMTAYYGDYNASPMKNMQPAGAVVFRRVINPHMAVRIAGMYTKVKGTSDNVKNSEPRGYAFNNTVGDLCATYEYNFWAYGTGKEYRGAKRVAPFLSLGLGVTYAGVKADDAAGVNSKTVMTMNIPLGVGVKYRIGDRMNLSLDWQMHFSLSDELDGVKDPRKITSNGMFKNTDCYSTLLLALTYSFSEKCRTCHKE